MAIFLVAMPELDARGGRGGGGRGGGGRGGSRGGGSRGGGRSMNRSPSMSRASHSRARPQSRPQSRPSTRPKTSQRPAQRPGQRPSQRPGGKTPTRNDVQKFLNDRPTTRPAERPKTRPSERPGQRPDRPSRPDRPTRADRPNRPEIGDNIRDKVSNNRPNRGDWFNDNFWDSHHNRPPYWGHHDNWWKWATGIGVANWLGWRSTPNYYGYSYDDDGYYWGPSDESAEPLDYSQQAAAIDEGTSDTAASDDWMPLGVFALSKEGETAATPNLYLQLALNKEGMLSGTYYNATTDETYEAEGLVDQDSQRAAWKIVDNEESPILETGIYNLTQSESPVRVYFDDGNTQDMMLVRLDEPEE